MRLRLGSKDEQSLLIEVDKPLSLETAGKDDVRGNAELNSVLLQSLTLGAVASDDQPSGATIGKEALKGAEKTIWSSRPDLAICVYHAPNHLWEKPLYIHSLGLGYRFYLRNYTSFTGETVLYATV